MASAFEMDLTEWEGVRELLAQEYASPGLVRQYFFDAANKAKERGVTLIQEEVRARAYRTGALHDSIEGTIQQISSELLTIEWGSELYYAGFVESGTKYMEGRFYLEHGINDHEDELNEIFEESAAELARRLEGR